MTKTLTLLIAALGFTATAQAHQIWLEQPTKGTTVIRFGEFGDNLRETSPGLLDGFGRPTATLVSAQGEKNANGSKTADGFTLPFQAAAGESIVAEDAQYPLYKAKQGGKDITGWYHPASRLITGFTEQAPKLTLDLVPTALEGQFKLYFKGQALPKSKVTLIIQSGWVKEGVTDEQGLVRFDLPWQGQYVAEVSHTDPTPGERGGEKYDTVNYVTTVTYVKANGAAPIPAGPAATPNR